MSEPSDRLHKLEERARRIQEQIARTKAADAAQERKRETRRKILVGSMKLAQAQRSPEVRAQLLAELDVYLGRDLDRALFGLLPKGGGVPAHPAEQRDEMRARKRA
jgi:hypothetical protein